MKLWDVLKKENVGKKVKDISSLDAGEFNIELNVLKEPILIPIGKTEAPKFSQSEIMKLNLVFCKDEEGKVHWDIKEGQDFFCVDSVGNVIKLPYFMSLLDSDFENNCVIIATEEKAKEVAKEQALYRMIKRFRDIHDVIPDKDDGTRYTIGYSASVKDYVVLKVHYSLTTLGSIYFYNKEEAKKCLETVVKPFK